LSNLRKGNKRKVKRYKQLLTDNEEVEDIGELSDYFILFCIDQKRNKKI
tara:strand:- start:747 stop:893 length:147 start_codon:yes stop_codon:yes gene_type:complete